MNAGQPTGAVAELPFVIAVLSYGFICYLTHHVLIARPSRHLLLAKLEEETAELLRDCEYGSDEYRRVDRLLMGTQFFVSTRVPFYRRLRPYNRRSPSSQVRSWLRRAPASTAGSTLEGSPRANDGEERASASGQHDGEWAHIHEDLEWREDGKWINHPALSLSKVLAAWRMVHAAERIRSSSTTDGLSARVCLTVARLRQIGSDEAASIARMLEEALGRLQSCDDSTIESASSDRHSVDGRSRHSRAIKELQTLLAEGLKVLDSAAERSLETPAEIQRRTAWLTGVGLAATLALGLLGAEATLIYGALGGFLAPATRLWQREAQPRDEYSISWAILMLGPVAGALAAVAGLLLVSFLADPELGVLAEGLHEAWTDPYRAAAISLLFGFSGSLLSRIGLSASNVLSPPSPRKVSLGLDASGEPS